MKVAELMTTKLETIGLDGTIGDAVEIISRAGVSAIPVIDRYGRAVGVVSAREILNAENACETPEGRERLFSRTPVLELMTAWPPTVEPDLDIRQAAQEMLYLNLPRLFVQYDGALVGVISQTDIVGAVATARV